MAIVGGSVIGLATALKAASAGFTVTVYDPSLSWANSAGWCAGGMLGGITEALSLIHISEPTRHRP